VEENILYKNMFEFYDEPIVVFDQESFIDCNMATIEILGLEKKSDIKNLHPLQIIPVYQPDGEPSLIKFQRKLQECINNESVTFEWVYKTIDEKEFFVEIFLKKIHIDNKDIFFAKWKKLEDIKILEKKIDKQELILSQRNNYIQKINEIVKNENISKEKLLDTLFLLNEYKNAIDESSIVSKTDKKGIINFVNDKFCKISGYTKDELIGKSHNIIRHPNMTKDFFKNMWKTILDKKIFKGIVTNRKKNGEAYYVDTTIIPILDNSENIVEFIGIRHDVTEIFEKERIIQEQFRDELTKLDNRQKLLKDIKTKMQPKIAIINIDGFRNINDFYGFEVGDRILKDFAKKLSNYKEVNFNIYRISNDIFAFLASGNYSMDRLKQNCEDLLKMVDDHSIKIDDHSFYLSLTIGLACNCLNEIITSNLLTRAEFALRVAKETNKNILSLDDNIDIYDKLRENKKLIKDLKDALQKDNLLVYGQKIINNKTDEIKYETLMRIKLKDDNILSPFNFLDQAKKAKIYLSMTRTLVKKACEYFKGTNIEFNLNLTLEDIKDQYTMDTIFDIVNKTGTAKQITFEIVESEGIEEFEGVNEFIKRAHDIGSKIAIDDFGTGYSNFEYTIKLNIDIIKIDGSLIKNIHTDDNIKLTVSTIVNFAKALNVETVAEYVHNKEVYKCVKDLGINYSQGYLLHEPQELVTL